MRHSLNLDAPVSQVYPLSEANAAFEAARTKYKILMNI